MPKTLLTIGSEAFANNNKLLYVEVIRTVLFGITNITEDPFKGCTDNVDGTQSFKINVHTLSVQEYKSKWVIYESFIFKSPKELPESLYKKDEKLQQKL